jgi:hypothetical protein
MPVFKSSEQLYDVLKSLFQRIGEDDPSASDSVSASKMIIRMRLIDPAVELTVNARAYPIKVHYGNSSLRPDFDVQMQADAFHQILLRELPLRQALGNGQLKVKGPVYKSFALADIFHRGQVVYPEILKEQGVNV